MKKLLFGLFIALFALHLQGQEPVSCVEAADQASNILDAVQVLLDEGNSEGASTLLDAAQTLLDNCYAEDTNSAPSPTIAVEDTNAIPSPTTATVATLVPTVETSPIPELSSEAPVATLVPTVEASPSPELSSEAPVTEDAFTVTAPVITEDNAIAFVRFANTSVDVGAIDIYMGRDNLLLVSNLNYAEATDFILIQAGEISFRARRHGAGAESEVLYHLSWNYLSNSSWIVTAAGLADEFAFIVEPISVIRNDYDGKARVRVVNWVAGAPRTTVTSNNGLVLGDGLGWAGIRDNMLDAGRYSVQVSTNNGASLPETLSFDFEANVTYTLYVIGHGTPEQPLRILSMVSAADTTQILFRNNSLQGVDLYYRPDNVLLIENMVVGAESDWFTFFSGSYTFIGYAPGTGPRGQELAAIAVQLRPSRYMVFEYVGNQINLVYEGLNPPTE